VEKHEKAYLPTTQTTLDDVVWARVASYGSVGVEEARGGVEEEGREKSNDNCLDFGVSKKINKVT
jgi:hypothetical protein